MALRVVECAWVGGVGVACVGEKSLAARLVMQCARVDEVEEFVRGSVVQDEVGGDPGAQGPEEGEGLGGAGDDAQALRYLFEGVGRGAGSTLVEVHVGGAVLADEDRAHVADDPVVLGGGDLDGFEEASRVDVGGQARRHGSDAEEGDVRVVDRVEDGLDGAFAPQCFLGVRVVEERGDREVDDSSPDGLGGARDDGFGVGHTGFGGC